MTLSIILTDIQTRTEVLNNLTIKNRMEVSSLMERYQFLLKERSLIVGKLYGCKKYQAIDEKLKDSMRVITEKVDTILSFYKF